MATLAFKWVESKFFTAEDAENKETPASTLYKQKIAARESLFRTGDKAG